ncbi:YuzL family protein [Bacillus paranthracis]|nr:YuzL family protein [Bacillus paranthracis]MED1137870.1 YuzL family protein [Bacillus paranthracis]
MAKLKKNPSKAGISAASVTGNAGPTDRGVEKGRQGNNQQYKKHNMSEK